MKGETATAVLLLFLLAVAIPNGSIEISTYSGTENIERGIGVWQVSSSNEAIPSEAMWVVTGNPDYAKPRENISLILNWYSLHPPEVNQELNQFKSESDIKTVESSLMKIQIDKFWGIIFICEEQYRINIAFSDDLNTSWFGERLFGYKSYLREDLTATQDDWKDEMYLRMIKGFYNYFSPVTKIGITWGLTSPDDWNKYYGEPAIAFIRQHYDFVFLYSYTESSRDFFCRTKPYLVLVEEKFPTQKKFWILTRIWSYNERYWKPEAMELEIRDCLEMDIVVTTYYSSRPSIKEVWPLILEAAET